MDIVFFASSQFAVLSLKALLNSRHRVSGVVTQPDRQKGRGLHLAGTAVKAIALESGLKIYQPDNINTAETIQLLKGLNPDLFIVISYGQILSEEVLAIPKLFPVNVHASLLPKYRGAAPINWAIINGEKITGVSIIKMVKEMDAGPIILQKAIDIAEDDTATALGDKLSKAAEKLLIGSLQSIEDNSYKLASQDKDSSSFAPKLEKEDGMINWSKPACEIYNLIRGLLDWPGAFTCYKGKLLKIYKASLFSPNASSIGVVNPSYGRVIKVSREGIVIATGLGNLVIEELQMEGAKRMRSEEFIIGHRIMAGEVLGEPIKDT